MACQQTILQEQHTEDEQINSNLQDFMPDGLPIPTLLINPRLGLARKYTGYIPQYVVKHGLILIIMSKCYQHSTLSKIICIFNFPCLFTFTYFICFLFSCDGNDATWAT